MWRYIWLMIKEEYRIQTAFSTRIGFLAFPLIQLLGVFLLSIFSPRILENLDPRDVIYWFHGFIFLYGMAMGASSFFAKEYIERRFGQVNLLLSTPLYQPISFRKTFFAFYIHEIFYYTFILILPMTIGLVAASFFVNFTFIYALTTMALITGTFLLAMSVSFLISSMYIRTRVGFWVLCGIVIPIITLMSLYFGLRHMIPFLHFVYTGDPAAAIIGIVFIPLFSGLALLLVENKVSSEHVNTSITKGKLNPQRYKMFGKYSLLVSKEMVDVRRSRLLSRVIFSYIVPLLVLLLIAWFIRSGIVIQEIEFDTLFYAALVGFFGTFVYSWLNNTDVLDIYDGLPVTVPDVIRSKLIVYLMISFFVSTGFVIVLALVLQEPIYIPFALVITYITSIYIGMVTAFLTGLRTNSYLFDPRIIMLFWALSSLPLSCIAYFSFTFESGLFMDRWVSAMLIAAVCFLMLMASGLFFVGIDRRWRWERFQF